MRLLRSPIHFINSVVCDVQKRFQSQYDFIFQLHPTSECGITLRNNFMFKDIDFGFSSLRF